MSDTQSTWRLRARRIINAALAKLPAGATRKDAERALRAVVPWSRSEGVSWPVRCWQVERRAALDARFGKGRRKPAGAVVYRLAPRHFPGGRPWLSVDCALCDNRMSGGCLFCAGHRARAAEAVEDGTFRALREDAVRDSALVPLLRDWLAERGIDVTEG